MRVMPASSAAWMVAMERVWSGRPSIDIGMPPSPRALTLVSPICRRDMWGSFGGCGRCVLAGRERGEYGCRLVLRQAGRAQHLEHVEEVGELDLSVDGDAVRPVLQVGNGGGDREAAGLLHAQVWAVHRGLPICVWWC